MEFQVEKPGLCICLCCYRADCVQHCSEQPEPTLMRRIRSVLGLARCSASARLGLGGRDLSAAGN